RSGTGIPKTLEPGKVLRNQGIVHRVLSTGRIQIIPDPERPHQTCVLLDALKKMGINSLLAVPLVTSKGVGGLLIFGDRIPGSFKEKELFVIEKIASQLAVALENARLYEEMRQLFFSTVASLANAI